MAGPPPSPHRQWRPPLSAGPAVVLVGAVALAALSASSRDDEPEAADVLAEVRSAVEDATSFRFVVREETDYVDESGLPAVTSLEGTWSEDQSHVRIDGLIQVSETIVDGDSAYSRSAESAGALADEVWMQRGPRDFHDDEPHSDLHTLGLVSDDRTATDKHAVEAAAWIYLGGADVSIGAMSRATGSYVGIAASIRGGFADAPTGFLEAITALGEPTVVDEAPDVTTLVATLRAPDDLVAAFGRPIPDGTVQLAVGPDDRPSGLRVRIEHGSVRSQTDVAFSDWNHPVDIPVPSGDDVDTSPWLDEVGLRGLTGLSLVAPTELLERWRLSVYSEDLGEIGSDADACVALQMEWFAPDSADVRDDADAGSTDGATTDYVATWQRHVDCALDEEPTPFRSGGPGGFPSRTDPNVPGQVEVLVGDTAVAIDSNLPDAERDALIASLAPVDVETLIAAASERPPGW